MRIRHAGDAMMIVEIDSTIDPLVNQRAIDLGARLGARGVDGVRDIVPGYCTLGIHFDPLRTDLAGLERAIAEEAGAVEQIDTLPDRPIVEIPVEYGGDMGPDLEALARASRCTTDEVIAWHAAAIYRVYMLGFVPGFAYMGRVDRRIAATRHRVPRERVAAGSVGVAGEQTGVYPIETPGGWQIIGRTSVQMFDPIRDPASLLTPGDRVRFVPTCHNPAPSTS